MSKLAEMTPVEIDTILADLGAKQAEAQNRILSLDRHAKELGRRITKILDGEKVQGITTPADGIRLAQSLEETERLVARAFHELGLLNAEAAPYEDEYTRRGGWNRVFLADSYDGHAHNGQNCSTCHHGEERTQFFWLVEYSGKTEEEIVADAGERACTTCYKSAPVNVLKQRTKMFTPKEIEAQKARELREAERARKAREAADKSITTPEGGPLYETKYSDSYSKIKNIRTAEIAATDALKDLIFAQRHATDPEWAWFYANGRQTPEREQMEIARHAWCLIRSIAFKKGLTFQEVFEIHEAKAQAKVRKIDREWAKDPRNPNRAR
jgi:hypothetical protein